MKLPFTADGAARKAMAEEEGGFQRQIALPFARQARFSAGDFVAANSNAEARAWLFGADAAQSWPEDRLMLWGESGIGKTHLLHVWAERSRARVLDAGRLGPSDWAGILDQAEDPQSGLPPAMALDHVQEVTDERALLHLLNAARERRTKLLLASRVPPSRWAVTLPDLASRLRATFSIEISAAEDGLLRRLLLRLLAERGLVVQQTVTDWMLLHLPRNAAAIHEAVLRLDESTLAAGGAITRARAAAIVEGMES